MIFSGGPTGLGDAFFPQPESEIANMLKQLNKRQKDKKRFMLHPLIG